MANDPTRSRKKKRNSPKPSDEEIAAASAAADSGDKGFHLGGSIRSDEYAVAVLRGVIEFRSRTGGAPTASTTGAFFESIKDSLPPTVTQDQLYRKVRRLRKKYNKVDKDCDAGEDVPYHELLREAWGNDEKKAKVDNFSATEEKKAKVEQSAFSTQKAKKAKVQPSGTDGKLQVKEVQWKGKVAFAKDAISSANFNDKIGKKRPSRTTSKKSKVKKLSPVATRGRVSGRIRKFWQDDYSDKEAPSYAGKDEKDWDTDDWFEASGRFPKDRGFYSKLAEKLGGWFA